MSENPTITLVTAGEHLRSAGWLSGIPVGVERAITYLNEQAGIAFTKRDDKLAMSLRQAADLLAPCLRKESSLMDAETTQARQAAYDRLEEGDKQLDELAQLKEKQLKEAQPV